MDKIILASGSEGRRELFQGVFGDDFEVYVSNVEEDFESSDPRTLVYHLAKQKAEETFRHFAEDCVFAFDTVVSCQNQILGKPSSVDEAREMLHFLNKKTQVVWTGYSVRYKDIQVDGAVSSELILSITDEEIEEYISTHPVTKFAGAYAIQKIDDKIEILTGSMDVIVGASMDIVKDFVETYVVR